MQTFCVNARWNRRASALVALVGGIALLPWQLEAQTDQNAQTDAQAKPQMPVQSKEPERYSGAYRIITVGKYALRIVDRAIDAPGPGNQARMSGVFGGKRFDSNQTCKLDVAGSKEAMQLFKGVTNLSSEDDRGNALGVPGESYLFSPIANPANRATEMPVLLALERENGAKSLKTLQGELVVVNGLVRTLSFSAEELRPGVTKRSGRVSVTLDELRYVNARYFVRATINSLQLDSGLFPHLPLGPMDANPKPNLHLEILGTNGTPYSSVGTSITSKVDKTISQTVGVNGNPAGTNPLISKMEINFGMEQGVGQPQNLLFHIVEVQGPPFRAPFKFTDIPLADPH